MVEQNSKPTSISTVLSYLVVSALSVVAGAYLTRPEVEAEKPAYQLWHESGYRTLPLENFAKSF